jgi:hypothetical protein
MNILRNLPFGRVVRCGAAVALVLLVAQAGNAPAGIQGSGIRMFSAVGPVTRIGSGSLVVGAEQYLSGAAQFDVDGHPGQASQLHLGDVVWLHGVTMSGRYGNSVATEVAFSGNVRGRVENIDPAAGTFQVLGQTVRVDAQTLFDAGDFAALREGDAVEASGFPDSTNVLRALRIDSAAARDPARVVGVVRNLDQRRLSFEINSLTVSYGGAEVDGLLTEGATVAAEGSATSNGEGLRANSVYVQPAVAGRPGEVGRIEGILTAMSSSAYFEVNGQPVEVNDQTQTAPLRLDVTVQVGGTFDGNGVLVASRVQTKN